MSEGLTALQAEALQSSLQAMHSSILQATPMDGGDGLEQVASSDLHSQLHALRDATQTGLAALSVTSERLLLTTENLRASVEAYRCPQGHGT